MESTTVSPRQPKPRWYRRRKLLIPLALLLTAAGILTLLVSDSLFMPADLQRMQGKWKVVRVIVGRVEVQKEKLPETIAFKGRHLLLPEAPNEPVPIEVNDGKFYLFDPDNEHTIMGFRFRIPRWLRRANDVAFGTYEFKDDQLILWLKGEGNVGKNEWHESAESQEKIFLERE